MAIAYGLIFALSLIMLPLYFAFIRKKQNEPWLLGLFLCVCVVTFGYFLVSISKTVELALWANKITYLGQVFVPMCMFSSDWKADADEHWHECECGDKANRAAHADENNDGKCDICDYAMGNAENPGENIEPEKTGLSGGAIAGIAVGSVAVAGLGGFSLFWFVIKKKKFADLIALFKKK